MPSPEKRTFSLPAEQAGYIDSLVATGSYASGSEVVRAGLRALQERDAAVEKWLREEVVASPMSCRRTQAAAFPRRKCLLSFARDMPTGSREA